MKFLVITNAPTLKENDSYVAYEPYVREMNIWAKYVEEFTILSPTSYNNALLTSRFDVQPKVISVRPLQFNSLRAMISSLLGMPIIVVKLFQACKKADHIHLRCPGNMGLLGCFVQIFFPKKIKTAKYAGNWDPNAKQPLSYRFQKWILSNPFLTKNMQVLVYGDWPNQTKNIKPFFTATYTNSEIEKPMKRDYSDVLKFVFVGTLVSGKRPLFALQIIEALYKQGKNVFLEVYGEGVLKQELQDYIHTHGLEKVVMLHGNQSKDMVKETLKTAHFLILPSKSEGWPKAIAEGMFFGVIPMATAVSCVPYMLGFGNRGILIEAHLDQDVSHIKDALKDKIRLETMSENAVHWSQNYTLDVFENEISKLLNHS
jgi:glycosyltransferase involved in cell wall biosynthesis